MLFLYLNTSTSNSKIVHKLVITYDTPLHYNTDYIVSVYITITSNLAIIQISIFILTI